MSRIYYRGAKAAIVCYGKRGSGLFLKHKGGGCQAGLRIALTVGCFLRALYQDLTDSSSFERAKFWVKELRNLEEVGGQTSPEE